MTTSLLDDTQETTLDQFMNGVQFAAFLSVIIFWSFNPPTTNLAFEGIGLYAIVGIIGLVAGTGLVRAGVLSR